MSITDELREYANRFKNSHDAWSGIGDDLTAIADHIDAEHESKVSYWQGASYKDGYDEGFASADDWLAQHEDAMAEHGWVRLPKDADGVPIHVGDVMEMDDEPFEVRRIELDESGEWTMRDRMGVGYLYAHLYHHHTPTVEDLIRDAILSCIGHSPEYWDEPIAECATKLQLKEHE